MASTISLNNRAKHLSIGLATQFVLALTVGVSSFLLRFDFRIPASVDVCLFWGLCAWVVFQPPSLYFCGATISAWRYFSTPDAMRLAAGTLISSFLAGIFLTLFCPVPFPRSIILIDFILMLSLGASIRVLVRIQSELATQRAHLSGQRALVYGAGQAGLLLVQEARRNSRFPYHICGFVDDAKHKGLLVQGVRVVGTGGDLKRLVRAHKISTILIAIPSASGSAMTAITARCQETGVAIKTMPAISDILTNQGLAKQIRGIDVEDILGRTSACLEDEEISAKIRRKVVLVTGAAGSIGSEMCRKIGRYGPAKLIAFDISETGLFFMEREMNERFPDLQFRPEVGSIQNVGRLREVFSEYRPALVLHAAAYKHVPLMEQHIFEAVENNIFGTHNLACVSKEYGVRDFVMISSDKAVNPTNIMGATKRVAELVIRSLQSGYVSVRFGNVLGSSGSVVPIFKQQIAAGGPVTVTHPDMERYFMTVSEASQLVLQACAMGHGGEIFVLDMGRPVKIVDLACQLIRLSGLEPEVDIRIEFTGMRPGEKLFEELNMADEHIVPTHHQKIKIFTGESRPEAEMSVHLRRLRQACEQRDATTLVRELQCIVPDYAASQSVRERASCEDLESLSNAVNGHFTKARGTAVTEAVAL